MDTIGGIPAHPLFVHAPAVLIPLAALGVLIMVARPAWWDRYRWATLAVSGLGALGAMLAAGSGEALEEGVEGTASRSQLHAHAEAGEAARTVAIVFFLVVLAATVVMVARPRRRAAESAPAGSGPRWLRPVVTAALVVSAGASTWTVFDAGHSGATSVWSDVKAGDESARGDRGARPESGEHGERGERPDHDDD